MIVDCISDLHGKFPELEAGDLLIVAGDLVGVESSDEYKRFNAWLKRQPHRKKIVIGGNHDNALVSTADKCMAHVYCHGATYLCDSGTEFEGLKIWGTPWTYYFEGMNPDCAAFTKKDDFDLSVQWAHIPDDTDILITHSPPRGILDHNLYDIECGSESLYKRVLRIKPKLHVFGHIHECGGRTYTREMVDNNTVTEKIIFVNASHMNEYYKPTHKAVRVEL